MKSYFNTKHWVILLLLTAVCQISNAQVACSTTNTPCNYVTNGGFENSLWIDPDSTCTTLIQSSPNFSLCVTGHDPKNMFSCDFSVCSWTTAPLYGTGTPDYYHACASTNPYNLGIKASTNAYNNYTSNFIGTVAPHSGNGYTGVFVYNGSCGACPIEVMYQTLNTSLKKGKTYIIGMWVRLAHVSKYACSLFAEINGDLLDFGPNIISDKNNWTYISTCYTATNDTNYLSLVYGGNQFDLDPNNLWHYTLPNQLDSLDHLDASYYYIDDVSITPLSVDAGPDIVSLFPGCGTTIGTNNGGFTCLPTGATITYSWSPSTGLSSTNTATTIASPSVTTSYVLTANVTYTNEAGVQTMCSSYDSVTVNVVTPTISITPSYTCNFNGVTSFTANPLPSGSYTYSWTVKDAVTGTVVAVAGTGTTGATPSFSLNNVTQPVNICASIINQYGCQSAPSCYYLPNCCPTGTNVIKYANTTYSTSTVLNSASGTNSIALGGTITVNSGGTLSIISKNVLMEPNTKIILNGTGRINLLNSYVQGCNYMWDGIYANTTNTVNISNSRVEDAKRVVVDSLGTASLNIINNYLNKNYIGIIIKAAKSSSSSVVIKNNFFSCSSIPTTGSVPYKPIITNLTNAASLGAYSSTTLKAPYSTLHSNCGIFAITASHTGKANSAITIGGNTGQENVFDKMQIGIWSYDSKTKIQNNVIQNIKSSIAPYGGVNAGIVLLGPIFGTGNGSYMEVGGSSTAYKNTFINNDNGIYNIEESALLTTYNTFSVQGTGIYVNANNNGKTINIRNNNFYQNNLGVKCYANVNVTTSIKDNNFNNTASAVGTYSDNFAIHCTEATLATNPSAYPAFDIDNNNISGYYNGIYTSQTLLPVIYDNEIHLRQDNTTDHWQSGINAANTNSATINNNIIDMTSYNQWAYWQLGINLSTNQVPKVQCNSINNLNMAITASGSNLTPANNGIIGNYMQNANYGVWLVNNGEIGDQAGNTGSNSSDNAWASSCNYYTFAQNSSNLNSHIFYTRSLGSGYDLPNAKAEYDFSSGCVKMFGNNSSAASSGSCNVNAATPSNTKLSGAASLAKLMQTAEDIAGDYNQVTNFSMAAASNLTATDDMNNNEVNRNAILRKQLLSNIMLQQIDVKDSKALNTFMSKVATENTGLLFAIDSLIHHAEKDSTKIAIAKQANAVITPNNKVEQSQQTFNELYLTYLAQNKTATNADVLALENLATQCPMYYGVSVYQARALLFNLKQHAYISTCEMVAPNNTSKRMANQLLGLSSTNLNVYPNPANTILFVNTPDDTTINIKLYDVMGHLVLDKAVTSNEKIDIQNLSNGIYIYKLYHNEQELKVGKLIITH